MTAAAVALAGGRGRKAPGSLLDRAVAAGAGSLHVVLLAGQLDGRHWRRLCRRRCRLDDVLGLLVAQAAAQERVLWRNLLCMHERGRARARSAGTQTQQQGMHERACHAHTNATRQREPHSPP